MLIDVANPGDGNVIKKEAEKILKYKDLRIQIQPMWIVKAKVIPVIRGATGTISKSLRQYLSNIPGRGGEKKSNIAHSTHATENTNVNVQNIFHRRNNITCSTKCKYRIAATQYILETWFVSGTYMYTA